MPAIVPALLLLLFLATACLDPRDPQPSAIRPAPPGYDEPYRPQLHFSPPSAWMNDPNGLVYLDGEYHLFYQYYPDSTVWGPMHWGHAVSEDAVHWTHLPVALEPDSLGYIFSGSAVYDRENRSGLGTAASPPLVALFTYHDAEGERDGRDDYQNQGLAFSTDRGRTWSKYAGNPVLPNTTGIRDFRDPKVYWDEPSEQWVMALAVKDHVSFYGSRNLLDWEHLSDFGAEAGSHAGVWECPDLFRLPVVDGGDDKYVLLLSINPGAPNGGSGTQYFVGDFDGKHFRLDDDFAAEVTNERGVWLDHGRDNYAGVTWSGEPGRPDDRLFIGWMSNWQYAQVVPTHPWRSAMTVARRLQLHDTPAGLRVYARPVAALDDLRSNPRDLTGGEIALTAPSETLLSLAMEEGDTTAVGFELSNGKGESYRFTYRPDEGRFDSDRSAAGTGDRYADFGTGMATGERIAKTGVLELRVILDRSSIEIFADEGATVFTELLYPTEPWTTLRVRKGTGALTGARVFDLASVW